MRIQLTLWPEENAIKNCNNFLQSGLKFYKNYKKIKIFKFSLNLNLKKLFFCNFSPTWNSFCILSFFPSISHHAFNNRFRGPWSMMVFTFRFSPSLSPSFFVRWREYSVRGKERETNLICAMHLQLIECITLSLCLFDMQLVFWRL